MLQLGRWVPPLLWTGVIAVFSSSALNTKVTETFLHTILPWIPPSTLEALNWIMRKGGHVTEYGVLTALWDRAFRRGTSLRGRSIVWGVLLLSLGTACLDELHQIWTPNRTGSLLDVLLDGAASGVTQWGLVHRARGGSFLWSVTGVLAWTAALLATPLLILDWALTLPSKGLLVSSAIAWGVLVVRRCWKSSLTGLNRFG